MLFLKCSRTEICQPLLHAACMPLMRDDAMDGANGLAEGLLSRSYLVDHGINRGASERAEDILSAVHYVLQSVIRNIKNVIRVQFNIRIFPALYLADVQFGGLVSLRALAHQNSLAQ